jgi:hypothetical protein
MVQKRTRELKETEREALVEHSDHDANPQIRERSAALLKIAAGQSAYAVARQGLLKPRDPDTVYERLDWYEQDVTPTVGRCHASGPRLTGCTTTV